MVPLYDSKDDTFGCISFSGTIILGLVGKVYRWVLERIHWE